MKKVFVKVYRPDGTFLKLWTNAIFGGFSKEINSGLGECVLKLAEKFDYAGQELLEGNFVKIFIADKETITQPNGELMIYSGYISQVEPVVDFTNEYILVRLLGHSTNLALDVLKNGTQTTLYSYYTTGLTTNSALLDAADVGLMMRAAVDRYRAENTNPQISYDQASLPLTSTTQKYIFCQKTYKEAIDELRLLAPIGYYFWIDEFGLVNLKSKPAAPTHTFILGKHFSSIKPVRSIETVRNVLLLWNGLTGASGIYRQYKDDVSIAQFGRRVERITNYGLRDTAGFDAVGNKFIDENKDIDISVTFDICDNNDETRLDAGSNPITGYDIESIQIGDTCKFVGFNSSQADIFKENMLITKIDYKLNKVSVTIKLSRTSLTDWTKLNSQSIDNSIKGNQTILESYT